jgi:hypothetical protein
MRPTQTVSVGRSACFGAANCGIIRRIGNERYPRMRAAAIAFVIALALAPSLALAQAASPGGAGGPPPSGPGGPGGPAPGKASPPPGAISRDQFIKLRAEAAGRLFDQIDTNHTGYITRAQFRDFMRARRPGGLPPAPAGGPPSKQ